MSNIIAQGDRPVIFARKLEFLLDAAAKPPALLKFARRRLRRDRVQAEVGEADAALRPHPRALPEAPVDSEVTDTLQDAPKTSSEADYTL